MDPDELAALARTPRERFADSLADGPDAALATFASLVRRFDGFVDGFGQFAACLQAWILERHGRDGLAAANVVGPVLACARRCGITDHEPAPAGGWAALIEDAVAHGTDAALDAYDRAEASIRIEHDLALDLVGVLLSHIYRTDGAEGLREAIEDVGDRTLLAWMPHDADRPAEVRLRQWAAMLTGNFASITITEDDAAFTITQDPCGTCTRQVQRGCYDDGTLALVGDDPLLTFGAGPTPVYRTHVAVMHYLMPIERTGVPWPAIRCPDGAGTGPCRVVLYKDPAATPPEWAARLQVGPGPT
ncbi:MAG: hypothetical protein KDB21_09905 [Acidimicrobiales bacterium]|nr:hypothetical protein [Acidimicrobiales bacterium]